LPSAFSRPLPGGDCAKFGPSKTHCKDAAFPGYECPKKFKCVREKDNMWYWQCIKA